MQFPIQNIEQIRRQKKLSVDEIADRLEITRQNYRKIEVGTVSLTLERLYELAEIFNMAPEDILTFNSQKGAVVKGGNVTYVPVEAQAGFIAGFLQIGHSNYKTFNLPFIEGNDLYMTVVSGDSMFPTLHHSDRIVVEHVAKWEDIKFGRIYQIVTKDGMIVKRVYSNQDNTRKVILRSDNPVYEPYSIDKQDIISIWAVKDYLLRTNLSQVNAVFAGDLQKFSQ